MTEDKVFIGFKLSKELDDKIRKSMKKERRNLSNWLIHVIECYFNEEK